LNKEEKDDAVTKKERCSLALKQGSVAVPPPTLRPLAPAYKYEQVFYKVGLELKGERGRTNMAHTSNRSGVFLRVFS
jgi:hypothetical protein